MIAKWQPTTLGLEKHGNCSLKKRTTNITFCHLLSWLQKQEKHVLLLAHLKLVTWRRHCINCAREIMSICTHSTQRNFYIDCCCWFVQEDTTVVSVTRYVIKNVRKAGIMNSITDTLFTNEGNNVIV